MDSNKEDSLALVDDILKWIRRVFIIILLFPFFVYFISRIDFDKEEKVATVLVDEEILIENGIHLESGLIVDEGYVIVRGVCGACHSLDLVTQNKATRDGWKDIIVWMQQTQNLSDLGENETLILDYLAKNYAPTEQGRRAQLKDIEWYDL